MPSTAGYEANVEASRDDASRGGIMNAQLLDERATGSLRRRIGALLGRATEADFAVGRVRIAGIDLANDALAAVRRCRVLIGRIDAETLASVRADDDETANRLGARMAAIRDFLESGRLEVRAAGLVVWTPDFSVLRGIAGHPTGHAVLVGAHYLVRPNALGGPSFTCVLAEPAAVGKATVRFDELWANAYDVSEIVHEALDRIVDSGGEHPFPHAVDCRVTTDDDMT